jgi:hypothetical protein
MPWPRALLLGSPALLLLAAALGRLRGAQSLSAPDLAFFAQSAWSGAETGVFTQTVLSFDDGGLLTSVHLSPGVTLLFAAILAAGGGVGALVASQALALILAGAALPRIAAAGGQPAPAWLLPLGLLHPWTVALAGADLRPLCFLPAAVLWAVVGLVEKRPGVVLLAGLAAASCREEAGLVLLALVPFAAAQGARMALTMGAASLAALALPLVVWGHLFQLGGALPFGERLAEIADGGAIFVYPEQAWFGAAALLCAAPALRAPRLLLPAALGFGLLSIFTRMEPAAPEQVGLHYLAVVHPLLLAGLAVGAPGLRARAGGALLGLALLLAPWAGLQTISAWGEPPAYAEALAAVPAAAGVLCDPPLAPALSLRPSLYVRGNLGEGAELERALQRVDQALLIEAPEPGLAAALTAAGLIEGPPIDGLRRYAR